MATFNGAAWAANIGDPSKQIAQVEKRGSINRTVRFFQVMVTGPYSAIGECVKATVCIRMQGFCQVLLRG